MASEIKFDGMGSQINSLNIQPDEKRSVAAHVPVEVTVTNHLGTLIHASIADKQHVDEMKKMLETKNRIQSGQYNINFDALSKKLMHHLVRHIEIGDC